MNGNGARKITSKKKTVRSGVRSFEYCVSSDVRHQLKNDLYPTKSQSEIWHCEFDGTKNITIYSFTSVNNRLVVSVEVFFSFNFIL